MSPHPALLSWHRPSLFAPSSHDPANEPLAAPLEVEDATSFLPFQINCTETKGEMRRTRNVTNPVGPPPSGKRWELLMASRIQEPASHSSCSTAGATRQEITNISPALVMGLAAKGNFQARSSCWVAHAPGYGEELQPQFAPTVSTVLGRPKSCTPQALSANCVSLPPFPRNYMAAANSF